MRMIVIEEKEFTRAFDECLAKLQNAFREKNRRDQAEESDSFRIVNYHVVELKNRLEKG